MRRIIPVLSLAILAALGSPAGSAPPEDPKIDLSASGSGATASVTGKIKLTGTWELSIHTLTLRCEKTGGTKTLNAFIPVKGSADFEGTFSLPSGAYRIWAVIDIKDENGRQKQITSDFKSVKID